MSGTDRPVLSIRRIPQASVGRGFRLLVELFTMLKRSGADQIVTYAAADIARQLG